jgi:hypothetical protein
MLSATFPNNRLTGPIKHVKLNGDPAPRPADLQIQSSNLYVWVQENTPGVLTMGPTNGPGTGDSVSATITMSSASLGLSDSVFVTFNGPAPNVAEVLDIDEPNFVASAA